MAKHEVVIHENTGATKELAPYLGSYIAKETVKEASFIHEIAQLCGLSAVQLQAILDGSFEAIEELEKSELVRVHTDIGVVCGVITGSFPTADAAFDKERNALELALRLDDSIKLTLADVVPSIVADESLTKLRVDNVMDLETPRPFNLIHGQHVFRVAGFNMELTDVGATVYLTDRNGVTYEVVVDEVISKQLFKGHTASLLEPGDYKLVVKSRAGDAEGPLQTAFRRVKYLKVIDPPKATATLHPTASAAIAGNDPFTEINRGISGLYLHSDGHTFAEGEKLTFKLVSEDLDEPDIRERTIAFVDNAPRVDNPFGDPIHTSLTGTVTFGNDSVEGEVAFVPEE